MTPVYLNPPSSPFSALVDQQTHEDQRLKLFISSSPYNQASASCSLSFPTFFDSLEPQTGTTTTTLSHQSQLYNQKADNPSWHGGASYDDQVCSSSSSLVDQPAAVVLDVSNNKDHIYKFLSTSRTERDEVNLGDHESSKSKNNNNSSVKWKSSKMRLIQKMANPMDHNINAQKFPTTTAQQQQQQQQPLENSDTSSLISNSIRSSCNTTTTSTTAATVRVCSDCNTNTTPLWRSGPRGPKSLCNACGIRQRKARRAMVEAAAAAAANGFIVGSGTADTSSSFMKGKVPNKEEKSRGGTGRHVAQRHKINKKSKLIITDTSTSTSTKSHSTHHHNKRNKLCLKTRFQRVFPQDVAEAAVLLMELSCGLINHSS